VAAISEMALTLIEHLNGIEAVYSAASAAERENLGVWRQLGSAKASENGQQQRRRHRNAERWRIGKIECRTDAKAIIGIGVLTWRYRSAAALIWIAAAWRHQRKTAA